MCILAKPKDCVRPFFNLKLLASASSQSGPGGHPNMPVGHPNVPVGHSNVPVGHPNVPVGHHMKAFPKAASFLQAQRVKTCP